MVTHYNDTDSDSTPPLRTGLHAAAVYRQPRIGSSTPWPPTHFEPGSSPVSGDRGEERRGREGAVTEGKPRVASLTSSHLEGLPQVRVEAAWAYPVQDTPLPV